MKSVLIALSNMGKNIAKSGAKFIVTYIISLVVIIVGIYIPILQFVVVILSLVTGWKFISSITNVFISFNPIIIAIKFISSAVLGAFLILPYQITIRVLNKE